MLVLLVLVAAVAAAVALLAVRQLRRARARLRALDDFDTLTGLPNRQGLTTPLEELLRRARRNSSRVAVCSVELWGFPHVNETYGHRVGDLLIEAAARSMQQAVEAGDLVARYSGPTFVIACQDVAGAAQAERRAERLRDAVTRAYEVGRDRIRLSASIGVTLTNQHAVSADDVILDATMALEEARSEGRGTIHVVEHSQRGRMGPSTTEHRLRAALDRGEFWLLYLPVVSLENRRIVGVEALLRWADPEHGLVPPGTFLRTLDETGLIVPVGAWVLQEATRQSREWQERYPAASDLQVTVNISARQLAQDNFLETIAGALSDSGARPDRLCLEITEAGLVRDPEQAWSMLRQVKQLGCSLALDDFGTGSSSLGHLRQYKVDNLKIDRTFVESVDRSDDDAAIVAHLIGLARALHLRPVAEGIETAEQADRLRAMGCEWGQGYYFSTPQPAPVIARLLEDGGAPDLDRYGGSGAQATAVTPDL